MEHGKARLKALKRIRPQLRDIAWRWDPIGLGEETREFTDDEYDCVIEFVVGRLLALPAASDLAADAVAYIREDMGIEAYLSSAAKFVSEVQRVLREAVD